MIGVARGPAASVMGVSGWPNRCGNPDCQTGWLQLIRRRGGPRFEQQWACSAACLEQIVARSLRTQIENWEYASPERPLRMPLGLILLSRGWISQRELQQALHAQRTAGHGRIGDWLRTLHGISSETIAKALAIQWNCAVLVEANAGIAPTLCAIPALLQRRYDLLLMSRQSDEALFLAARCRADHAAARAVEHIVGRPVLPTFVTDEVWIRRDAALGAADPQELRPERPDLDDAAGQDGAAAAIQRLLERARPADARLVRMHDHLWLRMWLKGQAITTEDAVLPLGAGARRSSLLNAG